MSTKNELTKIEVYAIEASKVIETINWQLNQYDSVSPGVIAWFKEVEKVIKSMDMTSTKKLLAKAKDKIKLYGEEWK